MSTVKTTKYNEFVRAYARKCRRDGKKFVISDAARLWSRLEGGYSWANLFNPAKVPTQAEYDKAMDNYADMQKFYNDRQQNEAENKAAADALAQDLAKERADAALFRAQNPDYTGKLNVTKMSQVAPPPGEISYNASKNSVSNMSSTAQKAVQFPRPSYASSSYVPQPLISQTRVSEPTRSLFHTERPSQSHVSLSDLSRDPRMSSFLRGSLLHSQEPQKKKSECDAKCKKWLLDNYNHLTGHHHFRDTKSFVNHLLKE